MLTFRQFQDAVEQRGYVKFGTNDWSLTDWATALAGEVGEACNFIKKRRRGRHIPDEEICKELADVVTYVSLIVSSMGGDLGEICAAKFNEVSERVGSPVRLGHNQAEAYRGILADAGEIDWDHRGGA